MKRALLVAVLLAGCGKRTEVLLRVHNSDLQIGTDVDAITMVVRDRDDGNKIYFSLGYGASQTVTPQPLCYGDLDGCLDFPLGVTLFPGSHLEDHVSVEVIAYAGTQPRIDNRAIFTFTDGVTQTLDLYLYKSCLGSNCAQNDQLCIADGTCQTMTLGSAPDAGMPQTDAAVANDLAESRDLAGPAWLATAALPLTNTGNVVRIVPARSNPKTLYVGTSVGLFLSLDGGDSWQPNNRLPASANSSVLAVDPTNPMTLYIGGNTLQKSTDGAMTFGSLLASRTTGLAIDPANGWVYAAVDVNGLQVNGGSGFSAVNGGLSSLTVNALAMDATNVYAATDDANIFQLARGSTGTWTPLNKTTANFPATVSMLWVAADGALWAAGAFTNLRRSVDRATWTVVTGPPSSGCCLVPHPTDAKILYAGTTAGVYKMSDGASWFPKNDGLAMTNLRSLAVDPINPETLWVGVQATTSLLYRSTSGAE